MDYDFYVVRGKVVDYDFENDEPIWEFNNTNHVNVFGYLNLGPITLSVDSVTSTSATLSWSYLNPPSASVFFVIRQHNMNDDSWSWEFIVNTYDYTYTIPNLQPDTGYNFYIESYHCGNYLTSFSADVRTETLPAPTILDAPITGSSMAISWTAVSGATGYEIRINNDVYTSTTNSFTFTKTAINRLYQLKVRATKPNVYGNWETLNLYYGQYGELNRDGVIDQKDVDLLTQYLATGTGLDDDQWALADLAADGDVDSADLTILRNYVAGNITTFPAGYSTFFFNTLPVTFLKYGDLTKDGARNQADVDVMKQHIAAGAALDAEQMILADLNGQNGINNSDLLGIKLLANGTMGVSQIGTYAAFYAN